MSPAKHNSWYPDFLGGWEGDHFPVSRQRCLPVLMKVTRKLYTLRLLMSHWLRLWELHMNLAGRLGKTDRN